MKLKVIFFSTFLFFCNLLFSQIEKVQKYAKAKIYYTQKADLQLMLNNGIAVDHGINKKNIFISSVFSSDELNKAKSLGFNVEIEIADMQKYVANRNESRGITNASCAADYVTPTNFELGTMGGFYTYTQMLSELDAMHTLYPNLITAKAPISNFLTYQNRPIYSIKISDNPTVNELEPEILFSAIHHAREPASMQQLIFYMWYLLENYATNTEIQNLVDNTQQYFIPVLNPDGYVFNELTNPNGGGYWRKNRRNNGDGSTGVDNNRNYSFHWGEAGVSNTGYGETWAGTHGFSEPENQAMKWFTEQHNFVMAINNHTYSGLLLYPFGYAINTPTVEENVFNSISQLMVSENGYVNQKAADLYAAAGDSDDWMYADTTTKNKIYAMTPEIGYSFWPAQNEIIPLCKSMLFHNLTAVHLITNYAKLTETASPFISTTVGNLNYTLQRLGLDNSANFTVQLQPITANIVSVGTTQTHANMQLLQIDNGTLAYTLNSSIQTGDLVSFKIIVNNGMYDSEIIIDKFYGTTQPVFNDDGNTLANYNTTNWGITTTDFYSPSSAITDSVTGNYADNENTSIELTNSIDLNNASKAQVSFYAKWDIEAGWDYAQFEISTDNGTSWIPQCGKFTKTGNTQQNINGEPMYDGVQSNWVKEEIDLSDYLGQQIKFRFELVSDGNTNADGFYFDDFKIAVISNSTAAIDDNLFSQVQVYPNPVNEILHIDLPNNEDIINLKVYTINGQLLKTINTNKTKEIINCSSFQSGIYFVSIHSNKKNKVVKFVKI